MRDTADSLKGWTVTSQPLIAKLEAAWASGNPTFWNEVGCEALVRFCSDMFVKADRADILMDTGYGPGWEATWRETCSHMILRAMLRMGGEIEPDEGKALANLIRKAAVGLDARAKRRTPHLVR